MPKLLISIVPVMSLALAASAGGSAMASAGDRHGVQSLSRIEMFFIPGAAAATPGKIAAGKPEAPAILHTRQGRVLFSSRGATIGMPVSGRASSQPGGLDRAGEPGPAVALANRPAGRETGPVLEEPSGAVVNFLYGPRENWRTGIPAYRKLVYRQVWPGVDLEYAVTGRGVECRWILQPGADPGCIRMETGGETLSLDADGGLTAELAEAQFHFGPLRVLDAAGEPLPGETAAFRIMENGGYGLAGQIRPAAGTRILASGLSWSSFWGPPGSGDGGSEARCVKCDTSGNIYIGGTTDTDAYPSSAGTIQPHKSGYADGVVSKFDPSGQLLFSTFFGGTGADSVNALALGPGNTIFLTGKTSSKDLPVTPGAYDTALTGHADAFAAKLGSSGNILVYCTYLGADEEMETAPTSEAEEGTGIAVDNLGQAYICGTTTASGFPVTAGSWGQTPGGLADVFAVKFNTAGSALLFSRRLAGNALDRGSAIFLGNSLYLTGETSSSDFPVTAGALQTSFGGISDAFFCKMDLNGNTLQYSTYFGGSGRDGGADIAVDGSGNAIMAGVTLSENFQITPGAYDSLYQYAEGFAVKIGPAGSLIFSTFLGSTVGDSCQAVTLQGSGNIYLAGTTGSATFPVTPAGWDTTYNGGRTDSFLAVLGPLGKVLNYSTFIGGSGEDLVQDVALDQSGNVVLTGSTGSVDFPVTPGAFSPELRGTRDAFITKINYVGSGLVFSTLAGGPGKEETLGLAADSAGDVYISGSTKAFGFPTTGGAFDPDFNGDWDVFTARFDGDTGHLVYATYLGGARSDRNSGLAVSSSGEAYLAGYTLSSDFPLTAGAYDSAPDIYGGDVFIVKLNTGGIPVYSTLLGGSGQDVCSGIAIDNQGRAYVTGFTHSSNFPTTGLDTTLGGGRDIFVTRLNSSGTALSYSTFLGGTTSPESAGAIAVDSACNTYIAGEIDSADFPFTPGSYDTSPNGANDVFALKINPSGTAVVYCTCLGGTESDYLNSVFIDATGQLYMAGQTFSTDFPVTPGAPDIYTNGQWFEGFVAKLSSAGNALVFSTLLGGDSEDTMNGMAVDSTGRVWVGGATLSDDYPVTGDAFMPARRGERDCIISLLNSTGTAWEYSTYLGGSMSDIISGLILDSRGNVLLAGTTTSSDFPVTAGAADTVNYGQDAFVCKFVPWLPSGNYTVGGLVGVGTTSPERALHLSGGNAVFRMDRFESASAFLMVRTDAGGTPLKGFLAGTEAVALNNGQFVFRDTGTSVTDGTGTDRLVIQNDGTAEFSGDVRAKSIVTTSTARRKELIRTLEEATGLLTGLRGVRYRWNRAAGLAAGLADVGFIAEELARLVPEAVRLGKGGPAGVEYGKVLAIALESMKDQQLRLDAIARQRDAIRSLLRRLEPAQRQP